jgi:hypothetical protein
LTQRPQEAQHAAVPANAPMHDPVDAQVSLEERRTALA